MIPSDNSKLLAAKMREGYEKHHLRQTHDCWVDYHNVEGLKEPELRVCALTTASIAIYDNDEQLRRILTDDYTKDAVVNQLSRLGLTDEDVEPVCKCPYYCHSLFETVTHLNDEHKMSLKRIIHWLETGKLK